MKIGQEKNFVPSAFSELSRDGERKRYRVPVQIHGRIIAINWKHRHYTVEGEANGYTIRETFKF